VSAIGPYTNREWAKCGLDIYNGGAVLAVTGRIRGIEQNVLRSSFQTGSRSSPIYYHIFFLIVFLVEAFMRNMTIILCIIYIIIILIIDNNAVININYGRYQNLSLLFKIPIDLHPQKGSPALVYLNI